MTTLAPSALRRGAAPTRADRLLLQMARGLERLAVMRMRDRAARSSLWAARADAADRRRDAGAVVHAGLLPR